MQPHGLHNLRKQRSLKDHFRKTTLIAALTGAAIGSLGMLAPPAHAQAEAAAFDINLPAQPLGQALAALSRQTGVQVLAAGELVAGKTADALTGRMTAQQALARLLAGSGLQVRAVGQTLTVERAAPDAAEGNSLKAVTVTATAERESAGGPLRDYVATRSATGTKTDTAILETPQSISVIGARELEDKGVTTLTDALLQTPGVNVNPYGFDSRALDWVMLRGFDGWYTSSYRDGLAQNVGITFLGVQTEVYGLERLEVLRGPSSVLFGKGDVGGVVNRVSKLPQADAVREITVQAGSFDRKQIGVDVGGAFDADGKVLYRLVGTGLDTGTQERYPNGVRMDQQRRYLAPSLRWQISGSTSLVLQAEYLRDDASDDVQYVTGADGLPTRVKEGDPAYSRIKTGSDAVGYQLEHRFDNGWTFQQKLRHARRTLDKRHILSFIGATPTTLDRQARHDVESVDETAVDTSVQGTVTSGALSHRLLFGIDADRSRAQWRRSQDMTSSLDLSNPVYAGGIADPATQVADTELTTTQWGLYAQDQIKIDPRWTLTVGARHDTVKSDNNDRFNATRTSRTDRVTSGRVGLNYLLGNGWSPYVSYAESFVPNVGVDAAGATFQPSYGKQVEAGIKYIPEDGSVSFTAALFNLEKTNVVTYDPTSFEARQIGKVRSRGIELETKARLSQRLRLTGSLTLLDLKVLASADPAEIQKMPVLTPKQTASVWLDYLFTGEELRGLSIGGGVRYVGKRWNDTPNTSSEPGYTLADLALRYDTGPWRFAINVNNLFDRRYFSGVSYGSYFRGNERNVLLTARYRF
ncbi:iron complex outermembrane recepter protein [Polaromonas sp. YR568]|uniref:TonB-dependent siderophore receptor n=1 Tax=Polaromonas sp. YR568 TaxID=1855301 RepID=UPI0008EC09A9|nr:TonB-dependent siderophore receptor [Polaromonas sp. YR568]SFV00872.1 iron complex outermembrane recepter protein [Polaromonas sp. YR568]